MQEAIERRSKGLRCSVVLRFIEGEEPKRSPARAIDRQRYLQEALTHAARHARARKVEVERRSHGARSEIAVIDDGGDIDLDPSRGTSSDLFNRCERGRNRRTPKVTGKTDQGTMADTALPAADLECNA